MKQFYTYLWLREDGTPYYVGKGSGKRGFISSAHGVHKPETKDRILVQEFESEEDAFEAEKFLIDLYGRRDNGTGCLRNLTDGGEDPPQGLAKGHKVSEAAKSVISSKIRVLWKDPTYRAHMSEAHKGHETSEYTRSRLREVHRGHKYNLGRKASEETKRRMSAAQLGRKHTEETLTKLRIAATERERRKKTCQ